MSAETSPPRAEPLSAADTAHLDIEAAGQPNVVLLAARLGVGGIVRADGSVDLERLRAEVGARLERDDGTLRRLRQRVDASGHRPVWRDCAPDLEWHVRPADGLAGDATLAGLAGRLVAEPLPLDRPPWELLLASGGSTSAPGLVLRLHHAAADGVGGMALVSALFGAAPGSADQVSPRPLDVPPDLPDRRGRRGGSLAVLRGVRRAGAVLGRSVGPTPLLGPIGPTHGVAFVEVDLARLSDRAHRLGATLNDILLTSVADAAVAALNHLHAPVPAALPVSVPVALAERVGTSNAVGVMLVRVPTGPEGLDDRVSRVARATREGKEVARSRGAFAVTRHRWGTRLFARFARHQHAVAIFVSNVRGPSAGLRVAGAPVTGLWAVTPLQGNVRLGVTALSYAGVLSCSVHVDAAAVPLGVVAAGLATSLHRLAGTPVLPHPVGTTGS